MKKIAIIILSILVVTGGLYIFLSDYNETNPNNEDTIIENNNDFIKQDNSEKKDLEETPQDDLEQYIRYDNLGPINIGILFKNPMEPNDEYLVFEIMLNNHSMNVDDIDYSKLVSLRNDKGILIQEGFEWTLTEGSGHHAFGILKLPLKYNGENILGDTTQYIELELKGIEDGEEIESSKFIWEQDALADTNNYNYLAYIPNVDDGTVSIIDTSNQTVFDEIKIGESVSHGIAITPDNLKLYTGDLDNGKVFVYDMKEKKLLKTIETNKRIHGIDISPDGKYVLLASGALEVDDKYNYIQFIDTTTDEISKTITSDAKSPSHIDFTKDSKYAYVSNVMSNDISIIDINKGEIIDSIKVGIMPNEVEPSPDDKFIYVANVQEGSISVVDMAIKKEVDKIQVSPGTHGVAVTNDGKYIWTTNRFGKNVKIIDSSKREIVKTIEIDGEPNHVSISPDGKYAYVTDLETNNLIIFNIKTYEVIKEIEIGNAPHEIDFAKM